MAINTLQQSVLNKARVDKFTLVFDVPPILKTFSKQINGERTSNTILPDAVQFSVFGSVVPEIIVPAIENRYTGNTLYVSSHSKNSYPPVNVKFNIDNQYNNYWAIYQWLNLMHDQKQGRYNARDIEIDSNFSDYQTDLTIYGLDEYNNKRIKFNYIKAFPTSIDTITFNYQEESEITSGFTFVYSQMHVELINT